MIDGMVYIMVLILVGNLEIGASGWSNLCYVMVVKFVGNSEKMRTVWISPFFDLFNANDRGNGLYHGTYITW